MQYPFYKCDLHLHLDGSLAPEDAWRIAKRYHIDTGFSSYEEYEKHAHVQKDCTSLYDYLACFDLPLKLLQSYPALRDCAYLLVERLAKQNVLYAEIRFAPQQHTKKGLSQKDSIFAVLKGIQAAMKNYPNIYVQIILCMMILPTNTMKENEETLCLCKDFLHQGVCALDLAGAEGIRPFSQFHDFFIQAEAWHIPYTIHAGESGSAEHVKQSIELHASRIGHGIHAIEDEHVVQLLKEHTIPLEICVTSNLQCNVVKDMQEHPVRKFYDAHIPITINTDNMSVSNTTLEQEYQLLQKHFGFTLEELWNCNLTALKHAFLPDDKKEQLIQRMQASFVH